VTGAAVAAPDRSTARTAAVAAVGALLVAAVAAALWLRLFSTFAPYDDEGCFLVTARAVARGEALYDEVHSLYGPAFALLHAGLHRVAELPLDHRMARLKTLVLLLCAAGAAALLTRRETGDTAVAALGGILAAHHLEKLAAEPGHPQDISALAIFGALVLGSGLAGRRPIAASAGLGALGGLLAATKLNLALFLALPLAVVLAAASPWRRWMVPVAGGACLALGPVLTAADRHRPEVWLLLVAVTAAVIPSLVRAVGAPPRLESPGSAAAAAAGAGAAVAASFGIATLALGTSWHGLLHGVVLQHTGYVGGFFVPPGLSWPALALGLAASASAAVALRRSAAAADAARVGAGLALAGAPAAAHLAGAFTPLVSGIEDRGAEALVLSFGLPLLWLAVPVRAGAVPAGRLLLVLTAALMALGSYPIAGGQLAVATVLLPLVGLVMVAEGASGSLHPTVRRAIAGGLAALVAAALVARLGMLPRLRAELTPMGLPGTAGIRTAEAEVERWRWLTRELESRADTFAFFPFTWNSLYLWTGLEPPTGFNFTDWPAVLTDAEQATVAYALERAARPHVVWYHARRLPPSWLDEPLARHLRQHYRPVAAYGPFEIRERVGGGERAGPP